MEGALVDEGPSTSIASELAAPSYPVSVVVPFVSTLVQFVSAFAPIVSAVPPFTLAAVLFASPFTPLTFSHAGSALCASRFSSFIAFTAGFSLRTSVVALYVDSHSETAAELTTMDG